MSINIPVLNAPEILRQHGLRAEKSLGQNFLHDPEALERIITASEIRSGDTILEIGPGLGSLTRYLAVSAKRVVCIEIDSGLIPVLHSIINDYTNVEVVEGDILKFPPSKLIGSDDYIVVANVPYYITAAIFRHLLENYPRPHRIVLTVQKEVAERICANPGDMSLLALSVQLYGQPRIVEIIPSEAFYPVPKVDSAVIRVDMHPEPIFPSPLIKPFFIIAKAGFSQKRKTLRNSLSAGLRITPLQASQLLESCSINPARRAETLSIYEWSALTIKYTLQYP